MFVAVAVATGYPLPGGLGPEEAGNVLYLDYEDGAEEHARRLRKISRGMGVDVPDKLKGEAIPLGARIIAFVEAIEDQRSSMMTEEEFLTMSEQYASKHVDVLFDPHVVAAYLIEVAAAKEAKV
jgi:hypothetical protein